MRLLAFVVALLTAAGTPALAGTVITSEISTPKISGKLVTFIETGRLRIETPSQVSIFRVDQNTVYLLSPGERKFRRMTAERMKQMAQMTASMRGMLEAMSPEQRQRFDEHLSPSQRSLIEKMLAGRAHQFEYKDAGGTASFGKWSCECVDELEDDQPFASLCVARISDLGLSEEDVGMLRRLAEFMRQGLPEGWHTSPATDPQAIEKAVGYPAYPVHMEIPIVEMRTTIETVQKASLGVGLFEIPADYQEEESMPPLAGPR